MSVLINMEMPKEGTVYVIDSAGQVWSNEWPTRGYTRLDGVKAVHFPPHGDLIDRDELMKHKGNCYDADGHLLYAVGTGNILRAPTIIPAEEKQL